MNRLLKNSKLIIFTIILTLLVSGCILTEKPILAYSVDNVVTSTKTVDNDIKSLKKSGSLKLWESADPTLSKAEIKKEATRSYLRFKIYTDFFTKFGKSKKLNVTKEDKKAAETLLKIDFGIAKIGHQKNLELFNKIPSNLKDQYLESYAYKAAYIRTSKYDKLTTEKINEQLNSFKQTCESKKGLFVIIALEDDVKKIQKEIENKKSFTDISNKYNSEISAAIQGGFLNCFSSSQFSEQVSKPISEAGDNKIVGPLTESNITFFAMTTDINSLTSKAFPNLIYYSNLSAGNTKFISSVNEYIKKNKPVLNKKYGVVSVDESGLNIKDANVTTSTTSPNRVAAPSDTAPTDTSASTNPTK